MEQSVSKVLVGVYLLQVLLISLVPGTCADDVRYENYHLYSVFPSSRAHGNQLQEMQMNSDSLIFLQHLKDFAKIIVAPHKVDDFELQMKQSGMEIKLDSSNVQEIVDMERYRNLKGRSNDFNWEAYQKLPAINEWLNEQAKRHPEVASVHVIGESYEKRDILALKISQRRGNKAVFIEAGIHAREWISPAVATFFINELLNNNSPEMQSFAHKYDWYFVVNVNPDGYVHTEKDRFWRKTRKPYRNCFGADPNRNFNVSWGSAGASKNPCYETYAGDSAHSEPEIKALSSYISQIPNLRLYISLHSYSQLILLPYGYKPEVADNNEDLHEIADHAVKALSKRYGTQYGYGTIQKIMYAASGSSIDWVLDRTETELAFCYELRPDRGARLQGFDLPPEEIRPTSLETIDSIQEMVHSSVVLGYFD